MQPESNKLSFNGEMNYIFVDDILISRQFLVFSNIARLAALGDEFANKLFEIFKPLYESERIIAKLLTRDQYTFLSPDQEMYILNHPNRDTRCITSKLFDMLKEVAEFKQYIRLVYTTDFEKYILETNFKEFKIISFENYCKEVKMREDNGFTSITFIADPELIKLIQENLNFPIIYRPFNFNYYDDNIKKTTGRFATW